MYSEMKTGMLLDMLLPKPIKMLHLRNTKTQLILEQGTTFITDYVRSILGMKGSFKMFQDSVNQMDILGI